MSHRHRRPERLVPLLIGMLVTACGIGERRADPIDVVQGQLVAQDFVSALTQLRGFAPRNTTLQMRPVATAFGESLASELRRAGYGMQLVAENDTGPLLVSYEAEAFENTAGRSVGYRLRIGAIELGREYELRGGRVFPMTALSVRGTPISAAPLDQSIFDRNRRAEEALDGAPVPVPGHDRTAPRERSDGIVADSEASLLLAPLDDIDQSGAPNPDRWQPLGEPSAERDASAPRSKAGPRSLASPPPRVRDVADARETPRGQGERPGAVRRRLAERPVERRPVARAGEQPSALATRSSVGSARADDEPEPSDGLLAPAAPFAERVRQVAARPSDGEASRPLPAQGIAQRIVIDFEAGSADLGQAQRRAVAALLERRETDRSRLSLLGCDVGATRDHERREALSRSRLRRVAAEIESFGIRPSQIDDGRCSGPVPAAGQGDGVVILSLLEPSDG